MKFKHYLKFWVPVIVVMAIIFLMSTGIFSSENTALVFGPLLRFLIPDISPQTVDLIHAFIRKCGHLIEYFILGVLLFRAFRGGSQDPRGWHWALCSVLVGVLYAASDEVHQSFVATRTASPIDVAIDSGGAVLAQIVCLLAYLRSLKQAVSS
ncbi:MAG: VanZ family protein [Acidobacteriia bacterium]|nr:VanZ family protein [Terriglobia bacterium]